MRAPIAGYETVQSAGPLTRPQARALPGRWIPPLVLAAFDLMSFGAAYLLLDLLGIMPVAQDVTGRLLVLSALAGLGLNILVALYPGYLLHHHEHLRRRIISALVTTAGASAVSLIVLENKDLAVISAVYILLAFAMQPFLRSILRRHLHRLGLWGTAVEIIGTPNREQLLTEYFNRHWQYGLIPLYARPDLDKTAPPRARLGLVAAMDVPSGNELATLRQRYSLLLVLADMPDLRLTGLPSCSLGGRIAVTLGRENGERIRRIFDLAMSLLGMVIALPILLMAAIAIKLIDPGPVFYRQPREGKNGRVIHVLKLRTMYQDADMRLQTLLAADPAARQQWQSHFKLASDPRIIPGIGRILRMTSLDELPQLLNILAGDMSIVGPRPFPFYHLEAMDPAFRKKRCSVMPGLTGLWQISERASADLELQCQLDSFYIDNRSFCLDIYIVFRTVSALFRQSGT